MSDTRSTPEDGYTKAQLARYFHCPESTIRYYCARFAPYLPARGDGRGRRYAPSCLEVLAFIRERLPEARTSRAVEGLLARRYPHCERRRLVEVTRECLRIGMEAARPFGFVGDIGHAIQRHAEKNGRSDDRSELERLRDEVRTLRLLVSSAEQTQQDDLNQLRQWLTRLAREQSRGGRE